MSVRSSVAPFEEYKTEVFKDILDIHLVGNLRLANAFRPHLKASKGCLINIGSIYSYFGSQRVPAYSAAKTAVVSLTKSLARLPKTASAALPPGD